MILIACQAFRTTEAYFDVNTQEVKTREVCGVQCEDGFSRRMSCDSDFILITDPEVS